MFFSFPGHADAYLILIKFVTDSTPDLIFLFFSELWHAYILFPTELNLKNVYYLYSACSNPTDVV